MADQTVEKPGTELDKICASLELDKDVREVAEEVYSQLMTSPALQLHSAQKGYTQHKGAFFGVSILLAIKSQHAISTENTSITQRPEATLNGIIRASFSDSGL